MLFVSNLGPYGRPCGDTGDAHPGPPYHFIYLRDTLYYLVPARCVFLGAPNVSFHIGSKVSINPRGFSTKLFYEVKPLSFRPAPC